MVNDDFFEKDHCDRCQGELMVRTTSWFTTETICANCSLWEDAIISDNSQTKSELEACGFIPESSFTVEWGEEPPEKYISR